MSGTILLADDSLTIQKVIELTFAETGFDVIAVSSGEELMEKLPECRPDIVICDVIMPGKDGYEVCQEIKSEPNSLHIPVILLTGTFEPFDKDRALAAGCSQIITKPFEARKLVDAVEKLVQGDANASFNAPMAGNDGSVRPPTFEGQVTPPPPQYEGQVVPPPAEMPEAEAVEGNFETRFMEPPAADAEPETIPEAVPEPASETGESDEPLDFTSTGFSEMEAAGQRDEEAFAAPPDHGLEYEFDSAKTEETPMPAADTGPVEPYQPPEAAEFSAPDAPDTSVTGEDEDEFPASLAPEASPSDQGEVVAEEPVWGEAPDEDEPAPLENDEAFPSAVDEQASDQSDVNTMAPSADTGPIDPVAVAEYADTAPTEPEPMLEEPAFGDSAAAEQEAVPEEPAFGDSADVETEEPETTSFESDSITEEAPVPESGFLEDEPTTEATPYEAEAVTEEPAADVEELVPPVVEDAPAPSEQVTEEPSPELPPMLEASPDTMPEAAETTSQLSDEDIDRIARRMLELAEEKIKTIAWEVIPDMAEIVVRERIRELEAKVESAEND